jgi:serine/threonine protein kinase
VNDSDHACIADFGLATVAKTLDSIESATCQRGHSARWAAPEVLSEGTHSKEADVFSFAMVMIEVCLSRSTMHRALAYRRFITMQVFTGMIPFGNDTSTMAMLATIQGKRPPRPTHPTLTKDLWALMQRCWDHDPHLRPEVSEALQALTLSVFLSAPALPIHQLDHFPVCSENTTWKRLISHNFTTNERVSLIAAVFLDSNQVDVVRNLSGDHAQNFIDVVDEVSTWAQGAGWLTPTIIFIPCQLGVG